MGSNTNPTKGTFRMNFDKTDSENVTRRNVLKTVGAASVVGVGAFTTTTRANDRTGEAVQPGDVTRPNPNLTVRRVDKSVKAVDHRYPLLTLSEDTVLGYIADSDASETEKHEARTAFAELRKRYPIKKVKDGNTVWLTLAGRPNSDDSGHSHSGDGHSHSHDNGTESIPEEDQDRFEKAFRTFAEGTSSNGLGVQHYGGIHENMTADACNEMGIDPSGIADHAADPDKPKTDIGVPDDLPHSGTIEDGLRTVFAEIMHHAGQYYDADYFTYYDCDHDSNHEGDFGGLGGAHLSALWHANEADSTTGSEHRKRVGHLTHFPQDMGVPLHTGMGWEQANFYLYMDSNLNVHWGSNEMKWLHSEYEQYVSDNWTGGHYLKYEFGSHNCSSDYCYYPINDVTQAIHDEADYTGQYSYEVYDRILNEGDVGWNNWSSTNKDYMQSVSENCIHENGLYTRGFIHEYL